MKVIILCGGQGTRIRDVSEILPKPMLPIGDRPILWHIMKIYAQYGFKDFVLCLGYKGWAIKEYFLNYFANLSDFTVKLDQKDSILFHDQPREDWSITLANTGEKAQTAARIGRVGRYLENDSDDVFGVTYGDGIADVDIKKLYDAHRRSKRLATITGVRPSGRFGEVEVDEDGIVKEFNEKPNVCSGLINGGFMIFSKEVLKKYFSDDENLVLERDVLPRLVEDKQLAIYEHNGFWQCIDTFREYTELNEMWRQEKAPWKIWRP
ncbi:MAG: glucose-1-phosphate cytidylyltransferase [Candidatus Omnitrophota bacterium]